MNKSAISELLRVAEATGGVVQMIPRDGAGRMLGAAVAVSGQEMAKELLALVRPLTDADADEGDGAALSIYVASSWRNPQQPAVVAELVAAGYQVYDFRNPEPGNDGFRWTEIDPEWKSWSPEAFRLALDHPVAVDGFSLDMKALAACDVCVLVMPCGRSAHLELGYAVGAGKKTIVLLADGEPELMYRMVDFLCTSMDEVLQALEACQQ